MNAQGGNGARRWLAWTCDGCGNCEEDSVDGVTPGKRLDPQHPCAPPSETGRWVVEASAYDELTRDFDDLAVRWDAADQAAGDLQAAYDALQTIVDACQEDLNETRRQLASQTRLTSTYREALEGAAETFDRIHGGVSEPRTLAFSAAGIVRVVLAGLTEQDGEPAEIDPSDLRIDTFRKSDQPVNQNHAGVRITHIPTGVWVAEGSGGSQLANREAAMKRLRALLAAGSTEPQEGAAGPNKYEPDHYEQAARELADLPCAGCSPRCASCPAEPQEEDR